MWGKKSVSIQKTIRLTFVVCIVSEFAISWVVSYVKDVPISFHGAHLLFLQIPSRYLGKSPKDPKLGITLIILFSTSLPIIQSLLKSFWFYFQN